DVEHHRPDRHDGQRLLTPGTAPSYSMVAQRPYGENQATSPVEDERSPGIAARGSARLAFFPGCGTDGRPRILLITGHQLVLLSREPLQGWRAGRPSQDGTGRVQRDVRNGAGQHIARLAVEELRDVEAAADRDVPGVGQRFHRHGGRSYAANRRRLS